MSPEDQVWRDREVDRGSPPPAALVAAMCRRHGFDPAAAHLLPQTGLVNWVFGIGDVAVLRVPVEAHDDAVRDAYTESVAVPAVIAAGIRTPELLVFDDSLDLTWSPYTIYRRVSGADLGRLAPGSPDAPGIFGEVGRELARLHRGVHVVPDPRQRLDQPSRWVGADCARILADKGFLDSASVHILVELWERLAPAIEGSDGYRRFLHQDLKTTNLMGHRGEFAAIIDWGDAGWGDPALEFRYLPMAAVDHALSGYREIGALDGDDSAESRILWDQVWAAVWQLDHRPTARRRGSNRDRPGARLVDLIGFLASRAGRRWLDRVGF